MEQALATASDLPAGQTQALLFVQMELKAYVEAAVLDIDNTPRSSPPDSTSDALTQPKLTMRVSYCRSLAVSLSFRCSRPGRVLRSFVLKGHMRHIRTAQLRQSSHA